MIARLYPELHNKDLPDGRRSLTKTVTFQVTEDCNLACTYCYQIHKTKKRMSFDTAKKAVDMLLSATPENNSYIGKNHHSHDNIKNKNASPSRHSHNDKLYSLLR